MNDLERKTPNPVVPTSTEAAARPTKITAPVHTNRWRGSRR